MILTFGIGCILTPTGILIAKSVTKPILRVSRAIGTIAEGKLDVADAERNDEIGDIVKSLDALSEKLRRSRGREARDTPRRKSQSSSSTN